MRLRSVNLAACLLLGSFMQAQTTYSAAMSVRAKVQSLSPKDKITIVPVQGAEEFGTLVSATGESFTFHDVDTNIEHTMRYEEVKKVKRGYGGYNSATKRHTDATRSRVALLVIFGGLLAVVVAVGVSLHGS